MTANPQPSPNADCDRRDDNLVFIEERGQIRPATPEERNLQRSRLSHIPVVAVPAKAA